MSKNRVPATFYSMVALVLHISTVNVSSGDLVDNSTGAIMRDKPNDTAGLHYRPSATVK